jgi:hypothetical protein
MKSLYQPGEMSSMRYTMILIVLSGGLLGGCAPVLQDLQGINANLKSLNANLRTGTLGAPHTVSADVSNVCDQVAFEAGFKDQYVMDWNKEIGSKEALYRLALKQHPADAAAQQNYSLYQGKRLSAKGVGDKAIEYGLKFDNNGHILNDCQARSYQEGKIAGGAAAINSFKALANQEI